MRLARLSAFSIAACLLGLAALLVIAVESVQRLQAQRQHMADLVDLQRSIGQFSEASQTIALFGADQGLWRAYRSQAEAVQARLQGLPADTPDADKTARRIQVVVEAVEAATRESAATGEAALPSGLGPLDMSPRSRVILSQIIGHGMALETALDDVVAGRQQRIAGDLARVGGALGGSALLFGTLCVVAFGLIHRRVARPVRALTRTVQRLRGGDASARAPLPRRRDELTEFAGTLNRLLDDRERHASLLAISQRIGRTGSWRRDVVTDEVEWSEETYRIFGMEPGEFEPTDASVYDRIHEDDRERVWRAQAAALEQGREGEVEFRLKRSDGELRYVYARMEPDLDASGKVTALTGIIRDITEERELNRRLQHFHDLVEGSDDLCGITDAEFRYQWVNRAYAEAHGLDRSEVEGRYLWEVIGREHFERDVRPVLEQVRNGETQRMEAQRMLHGRHDQRYVLARYYPLEDPATGEFAFGAVITDVTELKEAEATAREQEKRLLESHAHLTHALGVRQALVNSLPAHIALLDRSGTIVDVNDRWRHFGRDNDYADDRCGIGANYLEICERAEGDCAEEAAEVARGLRELLAGERDVYSNEYPCHAPGEKRWFRVMFNRLQQQPGDDSESLGAVAMHVDITERKLAEHELQRLAYRDPLTGLYSRNGFVEALKQRLEHTGWQPNALVILLDLRGMHDVNDAFGYEAGDELLVEVGNRLRHDLGADALVARTGGDQFLVFHPRPTGGDTEALQRAVAGLFEQPFTLAGSSVEVTAEFGFTVLGESPREVEMLVREAELALFRSRARPSSRWVEYTREIDAESRSRIDLTQALGRAVREDQLRLHFQPKVELPSGRLYSCEALLRWEHPELGLQSPDVFIPIAEQSQLIELIGDWVLAEACRRMQQWRDRFSESIPVSINVSPVQLLAADFPQRVAAVLEDNAVAPADITFEVTETVFADTSHSFADCLGRLRELGCRLSLDDFGTGYSSLQYLQRFPFDEIKVDRSFVARVIEDRYSRSVVKGVMGLAEALDVTVLAEGVENAAVAEALVALGCHRAQGYYFGMPLSPEDFLWLLRQQSPLPLAAAQGG